MPYAVGDLVLVPSSQLTGGDRYPFALYQSTVVETRARSVKVLESGGASSEWIATSKCHKNLGLLILTVGDVATESSLLDPLAKSLLQFARLLSEDATVRSLKVRSLHELQLLWAAIHAAFTHVVIIGHGHEEGLIFAVDGLVRAEALGAALSVEGVTPKTFTSLACLSGLTSFGGVFSHAAVCRAFLAPFHSVHGAVASQFAQTFFTLHLLGGESVGVAFRHARERVLLSLSFRLWRDGRMKAD